MTADSFVPRKIVITAHPKLPVALEEANAITAYLKEKGIDAPSGSMYDEAIRKRIRSGEFDLLIAVGGDGTMLRAGHLCAPYNIPVLGINMGHLGFLIQVRRTGWQAMFDDLFKGNFWIENRMMIKVVHSRSGETIGTHPALNDAVVTRSQYIRPVKLSASVDGQYLTTYMCDGLIAATPTGSTAYALAAGGPILPPDLRNILLVPIAPHLSVDRAIVLAEGSSVSIDVRSEGVALSVDGQLPINMQEDDRVDVCTGEDTVRFVRFGDHGYFYRNLAPHMNTNPSTGSLR